jgi:PiT family inorganic phosphate transporter
MSDTVMTGSAPASSPVSATRNGLPTALLFIVLLVGGLGYALYGLLSDMSETHTAPLAIGTLVLLGVALLVALGFEFVTASTTPPTRSRRSSTRAPWRPAWPWSGPACSTSSAC